MSKQGSVPEPSASLIQLVPRLKLLILKIRLEIITIIVIYVFLQSTQTLYFLKKERPQTYYMTIFISLFFSSFFEIDHFLQIQLPKNSVGIQQNCCCFKSRVFFQLLNVRLYALDFHTENIQELCGKCVGHAVKYAMPKVWYVSSDSLPQGFYLHWFWAALTLLC